MGDKSTPFGIIVSRVEVVKPCFSIIIVATVADRVIVCEVGVCFVCYFAVSVGIVGILCLLYTVFTVDSNHIAVEITDVEIILSSSTVVGISDAHHTLVIVKIDKLMGVYRCVILEGFDTVLTDKPAAAIIPIICFVGGVRAAKNYLRSFEYLLQKSAYSIFFIGLSQTKSATIKATIKISIY